LKKRIGAAVALIALAGCAPAAAAATVTVNTTADIFPVSPCSGAPNDCPLRSAITAAGAGGTVMLPASGSPYVLTMGELAIASTVTIQGASAEQSVIDGNAVSRVIHVSGGPSVKLTLRDVTVQNGFGVNTDGVGVVINGAAADLQRVIVQNNLSSDSGACIACTHGAGILDAGSLVMSDSIVRHNNEAGAAAGIAVDGSAIIQRSTISNNTAEYATGVYESGASSTLTLSDSTVSDNTAASGQAGIRIDGAAAAPTLTFDTISGNTAAMPSGGLFTFVPVKVSGVILAGNSSPQCALGGGGGLTDGGHNLESGTDCGFSNAAAGDRQNADPLLSPLAANGGFATTRALGPGSPAISGGGGCQSALPVDERGVTRPTNRGCDIGAFTTVVAPVPGTPPLITGTAPYACSAGTWGGDQPQTYVYGWLRDGAFIDGATQTTYAATPADVGHALSCRVTATNVVGNALADSLPVTVLRPGSGETHAPTVSNLTQSHATWREGSALASFAARRKKRKPPVGTAFSFVLSDAAAVRLDFVQRIHGRSVHGRCVRRTTKNHAKRACRRVVIAGSLSFSGHLGRNKVGFQGRTSRTRKLKPGRFALVLTATNAARQSSSPKSLTFTIVN
jgi:hypothetical protein